MRLKLALASDVVRANGLRFGVAVGVGMVGEAGTDFKGRNGEVCTVTGADEATGASFEEGAEEESVRCSEASVAAILDASNRRCGRRSASRPVMQEKNTDSKSSVSASSFRCVRVVCC